MRILYFGSYNTDYSRNRVLIKALKSSGAKVIECQIKPNDKFGMIKLFLRHLRLRNNYDIMIVGFPGQKEMFLARAITRKPIIFDAFTSHYGGYILDRQKYPRRGMMAVYYRFLDRWSCHMADLVLLDTNAHIKFFVNEFNLDDKKFARIFVGTDSDKFYPKEKSSERGDFLVHFHGTFIPLQGVDIIVRAAKLLEKDDITFNIIGKGQTFKKNFELAEKIQLNNIKFIEPVSYDALPGYINSADVCLGIFGDTPKSELVIPNKIYEALACAKPVITARTEAVLELLTDKKDVLLSNRADPEDLANKIRELKSNDELRKNIGRNGYDLFKNKLTEEKIGLELSKLLNERITLSK